MSKEKTEYRFSVHAAPAVINQVIQNYLAANQYVQIPKPNANYYFFNDPWMKGKRSIEYYIHGTEVIVLAGISVLLLILSIVYTASHPVRSYRYY